MRVEAQALVRRLLADPDAPPVDNPVAELSRIAGVMGHAVDVLGELVNEAQDAGRLEYADVSQVRRMNVLFEAWKELTVEYRRALTDMVRLGIEAHQARINEQLGMELVAVIRGVLDAMLEGAVAALGDDAAAVARVEARWPQLVGEVVPRQIQAVTSGG
ncbi:hypothetical protein [Microbispora rosea]|uniref:hypothetical protein n=1 Tax=Microbispora rosea TaxID=58117 RepID=UPI0037B1A966